MLAGLGTTLCPLGSLEEQVTKANPGLEEVGTTNTIRNESAA